MLPDKLLGEAISFIKPETASTDLLYVFLFRPSVFIPFLIYSVGYGV